MCVWYKTPPKTNITSRWIDTTNGFPINIYNSTLHLTTHFPHTQLITRGCESKPSHTAQVSWPRVPKMRNFYVTNFAPTDLPRNPHLPNEIPIRAEVVDSELPFAHTFHGKSNRRFVDRMACGVRNVSKPKTQKNSGWRVVGASEER